MISFVTRGTRIELGNATACRSGLSVRVSVCVCVCDTLEPHDKFTLFYSTRVLLLMREEGKLTFIDY